MDANAARKRLEELLAELEATTAVLQHSGGADTGELSSVDQHPADSGTALADADREEASLEVVLAQQERVRAALARVDAGTYGQCVDCGRASAAPAGTNANAPAQPALAPATTVATARCRAQ